MNRMDRKMGDPFIRTAWLLGPEGMARLRGSTIAVFGIGGVGSYTVEALARSGVGHLVLVDYDRVDITNINRQLHATVDTLGRFKVDVMRERVLSINPQAEVATHAACFQPGDPDGLLVPGLDYVVDAIDSLSAKIGLITRAKALDLPIISCMGAGNKLDPTRFEVADIYDTSVCPLSKLVRRQLRQQNIQALKVVYSREQPLRPMGDALTGGAEADGPGKSAKRNSPGSVSFVPSVAGLIIAAEVIKDLLGQASRPDG